jgi:ABC-type phosphate transport system auxiliary subunit
MAKRKTPKAKKIVDLKPRAEKVTDEQLAKIQNSVSSINNHQMELGRMETRKHQLLHNLNSIQDQLTLLQDELQKEYNTIDINIETGEINYPPENTNPPENGEVNKED